MEPPTSSPGLPGLTRNSGESPSARPSPRDPTASPCTTSRWRRERRSRWYTPGEGPLPREEDAAEMFRDGVARVARRRYEHYEVSSYAKPGGRCAHNQVYWNGGEKGWYGFGMAATSRVGDGKGRVARPRKMREWEALVDAMPEPVDETAREDDAESETGPGPVDSESADAHASASRAELRAEALLERADARASHARRRRPRDDREGVRPGRPRRDPRRPGGTARGELAAAYRIEEAGGDDGGSGGGREARVDAGEEGEGWRVRRRIRRGS